MRTKRLRLKRARLDRFIQWPWCFNHAVNDNRWAWNTGPDALLQQVMAWRRENGLPVSR